MEVNTRELRKNLAAILSKAEKGEEVVVTRNGKAVIKLVSTQTPLGLELDELATFRKTLGISLKHNPVVTSRNDERF
ncbi:MAG: type II toxin-antitoxin system Phd/YefM family antitoxin [Trueperaceae bacterium]